ncbi:MAG: DUF952 domain-containing protein [Parvibaculales bacterium]
MPETDSSCIYKICDRADWQKSADDGVFHGTSLDVRDGFIHFSDLTQLHATAGKHFAGKDNLIVLEVEVKALQQSALKWETSRGGAVFPHLYAPLSVDQVRRHWPLPLVGGQHCFPEELKL